MWISQPVKRKATSFFRRDQGDRDDNLPHTISPQSLISPSPSKETGYDIPSPGVKATTFSRRVYSRFRRPSWHLHFGRALLCRYIPVRHSHGWAFPFADWILFTIAEPAIDNPRLATQCIRYFFHNLGDDSTSNPEAARQPGLDEDNSLRKHRAGQGKR